MRKVKLTYFKWYGKYYTDDTYESHFDHDYDIYKEVRGMRDKGELPGLVSGAKEFHILIEPEEGVSALIVNQEKPND